MTKKILVLLFAFWGLHPIYAQIKHSHSITTSFLQLKDGFNLGMVFNGTQLEYRYGMIWKWGEHEFEYQPKIAIGAGFSHGMAGFQIKIVPVNLTWSMPIFSANGHAIIAGLNFATDGATQLYPWLHANAVFWEGEIGLSPIIRYGYQWETRRIIVGLKNSLLGFVSRTPSNKPYFNPSEIPDLFFKPYTGGLQFGSFNRYNHSVFSFEYVPDTRKKHSFVYEFEYFGTYVGVRFNRLYHSLIWKISL